MHVLQERPEYVSSTFLECFASDHQRLAAAAKAAEARARTLAGRPPTDFKHLPFEVAPPDNVPYSPSRDCETQALAFSRCGKWLAVAASKALPQHRSHHTVVVYSVGQDLEEVGQIHTQSQPHIAWGSNAHLAIHHMESLQCAQEPAMPTVQQTALSGEPLAFVLDVEKWEVVHCLGSATCDALRALGQRVLAGEWCSFGQLILIHWRQGGSHPASERLLVVDVHADAIVATFECSRTQPPAFARHRADHAAATWHPKLKHLLIVSSEISLSEPRGFTEAGIHVAYLPSCEVHNDSDGAPRPAECLLLADCFSADGALLTASMHDFDPDYWQRFDRTMFAICALSGMAEGKPAYVLKHAIDECTSMWWAPGRTLLVLHNTTQIRAYDATEALTGTVLHKFDLPDFWDLGSGSPPGFVSALGVRRQGSHVERQHCMFDVIHGQQIMEDDNMDGYWRRSGLAWAPSGCAYVYLTKDFVDWERTSRGLKAAVRLARFVV